MLDVISYSKAKKVEEDLVAHKEGYANQQIKLKNEHSGSTYVARGNATVTGDTLSIGSTNATTYGYAYSKNNVVSNTLVGNLYYIRIPLVSINKINIIRLFSSNDNPSIFNTVSRAIFEKELIGKYISQIATRKAGVNFEFEIIQLIEGASLVVDLSKISVIDLTETFGVGNEPTKEEMDLLIDQIPNKWFDGEIALSQRQIMNWELALIRQNRKAIIALGGAII